VKGVKAVKGYGIEKSFLRLLRVKVAQGGMDQ
jgi:hypothetical protein